MSHKDYYTSERFIWDDLIESSERAMQGLYDAWKKRGRIDDFLITWPAEAIIDRQGTVVKGPCAISLDTRDPTLRQEMLLKTLELTKAYALLLVEQLPTEVQAILESRHGAKCWTIPIIKSGDAKVLGPRAVTTDGRHVGLLWSPTGVSA